MIRTAVNLLLILAMALQPLAVLGVPASCNGSDSQSVRLGCCCCQAPTSDHACCCCGSVATKADQQGGQELPDGVVLPANTHASIAVCLCEAQQLPISNHRGGLAELQTPTDGVLQRLESYGSNDCLLLQSAERLTSTPARAEHYAQQCLSVWLI